MPFITILPQDEIIEYKPGDSLREILKQNSVDVAGPCNGRGTCGKCRVYHISGSLPPLSPDEKRHLSAEDQQQNIRLTCLVRPEEDIVIALLQNEKRGKVLADGFVPDHIFAPSMRKSLIDGEHPSLDNQISYSAFYSAGAKSETLSLPAMQNMPVNERICTGVYYNGELLFIEPGDTREAIYGLAIDIGTTTIVVSLVNLCNGKTVKSATDINSQTAFGLDVLTRISYIIENPKTGLRELQETIVGNINGLIKQLCDSTNISHKHIYNITVAANPTMMHLLLGINPSTIGTSPFVPIFVNSVDISARDIGIYCSDVCRLYCLPSVSAYIGADIVAGTYVSGLAHERGNVLFIDIGTNGEIVLASNGKLTSCSCAAGPALEGMNISAGVRAVPGAIEDVHFSGASFNVVTIDNEEPVGICGSGILAAVRELLSEGFIKKNGALLKAKDLAENDYRRKFLLDEKMGSKAVCLHDGKVNICITQQDIRQVQLAKGAILSGFYTLLDYADLDMRDLDKVIIAGQFGAHLPIESLVGVDLLPSELLKKIVYIGNSSLTGAYLALVSQSARIALEELAPSIEYKELSMMHGYERLFAKCLEFSVLKVTDR